MPKLSQVITLLFALAVIAVRADASQRRAMLIDAGSVVPGLLTDIRYAGFHNFVGRPIDGYGAPRCLLTQAAADALAEVARDLAPGGLVIKAFDCYRPARAVANFVRWPAIRGIRPPKRSFILTSISAPCFGMATSPRDPAIRAARPSI